MQGVMMNGLPGNPMTDPFGFYTAQVYMGWSGTVTPTFQCMQFTPSSRTYLLIGGSMLTIDGERCISPATITLVGVRPVTPVVLINKAVGGSDWFYNSTTGAGQKGVKDGYGINTIGMALTTTGRVLSVSGDYCWLDDGSGVIGASAQAGVKVYAPGLILPSEDSYAAVTGICTSFMLDGELYPLIQARSQSDIFP